MKYLLLLVLVSSSAFAEVEGVKYIRVACDGGVLVKAFTNPVASDLDLADKLADAAVCPRNGRAWVEKNYWHRAKFSSSSRSSSSVSSAPKSSVSSSSAPATIPLVFGRPTAREDGTPLAPEEIKHYVLDRSSKFLIIESKDDPVRLPIEMPSEGEALSLATVDTDGVYSKFVPVQK